MKQRTYIAILLALTITSCHSTKSVTESTVTTKDSTATHKDNRVKTQDSTAFVKHTADSVIGLKARYVDSIFKPEDLKPAIVDGKKVGRYHRFEGDGITGSIRVDTSGNVTVDCKSDSLTLVIKNLVKELLYIGKERDSVVAEMNSKSHSLEAVSTSKKKVKNVFGAWWTYLIFLGVGLLLSWLLKMLWKAVKTYFGK